MELRFLYNKPSIRSNRWHNNPIVLTPNSLYWKVPWTVMNPRSWEQLLQSIGPSWHGRSYAKYWQQTYHIVRVAGVGGGAGTHHSMGVLGWSRGSFELSCTFMDLTLLVIRTYDWPRALMRSNLQTVVTWICVFYKLTYDRICIFEIALLCVIIML